jgi:hypothetical protein
MNRTKQIFFALVCALSLVACDMTDVLSDDAAPQRSSAGMEISEQERDELEKYGHFLKLTHMPLHTQFNNVSTALVAHSASVIAKININDIVRIYRDKTIEATSVYIPLVYNNDTEFVETGIFYVAFTIHVDALTSYVVTLTDKIQVPFIDGRGELDSRLLPVPGSGDSSLFLSEQERDELEKYGHFLKITHMPVNTQTANITSVQIANAAAAIAKLNKNEQVRIFTEKDSATVYLPLAYNDDIEFIETGSFYTAFTIHIDALTNYILVLTDKILVPFTEGRGTLDIRTLPYRGPGGDAHRYLVIYNLPPHLLAQNVSNVMIHNQTSPVAQCENYGFLDVSSFGGSATLSVPLAFIDPPSMFTGTGSFYVAFDINIDALTRYTVTAQDRVLVPFNNGTGYLNVNDLPTPQGAEHRYLTIINLPSTLLPHNVSNVMIHNQTGPIAKCEDYSLLEISASDDKSSLRIPLVLNNPSSMFTGTGNFLVTFDINIDAETRFTAVTDDQILVYFNNGNGSLDILNLPEKSIPYLTIQGLPYYTTKAQISGVSVYNLVGSVASCNDINAIVVSKNDNDNNSTAKIPLSYSSGDDYFRDTGRFAVTFTVNVDIDNQFIISRDDNIYLEFSNGSAFLDIENLFGFFDAELANPSDTAALIIKGGSSFDIDGYRHTVPNNLNVPAYVPNNSCVLFLYAFRSGTYVFYEYSSTAPNYNPAKGGYYNGNGRALWKMFYLSDGQQFLFKTYIDDTFPQFGKFVLSDIDFNLLTSSLSAYFAMDGANNPEPATITLQPGVYLAKLVGCGGGSGAGGINNSIISQPSGGGDGGSIIELFTIETPATFTAYTGTGGFAAPQPTSPDSAISIYALPLNSLLYSAGRISASYSSSWALIHDFFLSSSGGGGGGGGAGTFLYSDNGYFLCAGGGGGGSGASGLTTGGGGGAGGALGPGGGGGAAGSRARGGTGGGRNGGGGGGETSISGGNGLAIPPTSTGFINGGQYTHTSIVLSLSSPVISITISGGGPDAGDRWEEYFNVNAYSSFKAVIPETVDSGSGGNTAIAEFYSLPNAWANTKGANGNGASAPSLNPITGSWPPYVPSQSFSAGYDPSTVLSPLLLPNLTTISPPAIIRGSNGSPGGNNRNSSRGGGAPGGSVSNNLPSNGSAGSLTIYKLY